MNLKNERTLVLALALLGAVCAKLGFQLGNLQQQVESQQDLIKEQNDQLDAMAFCQGGDAS